MRIVLDSSATLAFVYSDETSDAIDRLFDQIALHGALVPRLWHLEVANALTSSVRRHRLTAEERDAILADLAKIDISVDDSTEQQSWRTTIQLADRHGLSVYDASYLELAKRKSLPLATLDGELVRAAQLEDIEILGRSNSIV